MCDTPHIVLLLPRPAARAPPAACCLLLAARTCLTLPVATTHATVATSPGAHTRTHTDNACETARCVQERFEVRGWRLEAGGASQHARCGRRACKKGKAAVASVHSMHLCAFTAKEKTLLCTAPSTHTRTLHQAPTHAHSRSVCKTRVCTGKRRRLCALEREAACVHSTKLKTRCNKRVCTRVRAHALSEREREIESERASERESARERERERQRARERERERERMRMTC